MGPQWRKIVVIMLMGLLFAGPFAAIHGAVAQQETGGALAAAKAANTKAAKDLQQTMTEMDTMSKMPMTANEKAMMRTIHELAVIVQTLIDANKNLINIAEHGMRQ
jgi:hypothetical protein